MDLTFDNWIASAGPRPAKGRRAGRRSARAFGQQIDFEFVAARPTADPDPVAYTRRGQTAPPPPRPGAILNTRA